MKPTIDWLQEKYDEANEKFFNGKLGDCDFELNRSASSTLGFFNMKTHMKIERNTRRIYIADYLYDDEKFYLDSENFAEYARPYISINLNYNAPEDAWFDTLVHEMCHYATYCDGYAPKQHHGPEFKSLARRIYRLSDGKIDIARFDKTGKHEIDADVKQKMELRKQKRNRTTAENSKILMRYYSGEYQICIPQTQSILERIVSTWSMRLNIDDIWESNDTGLKYALLENRYSTTRSDVPSVYSVDEDMLKIAEVSSIDEFIKKYRFNKHIILRTKSYNESYDRDLDLMLDDIEEELNDILFEYVKHVKGHKNSRGESAPWVIVSHDTGKILSSHKTKGEAERHLQHMHMFSK